MKSIVILSALALLTATTVSANDFVVSVGTNNVPKEDLSKRVMLAYAATLFQQGKPQDAIDQYLDPVITYYQKTYVGSKSQIYCARSTSDALIYMSQAAVAKRAAVALGSTWSDAIYMKAYALVNLGRPEESRPLLEQAIALSPNNSEYRSELGNYYQQKKDFVKALATFNEALSASDLSPDPLKVSEKTRALRGIGYSMSELGRYDEAEAAYRKALLLNPNDKGSQAELLYIARKRGKGSSIKS